MTDIAVFDHPEFGSVRQVLIDGDPWFVFADVCRALEIGNTGQAITYLDDDEKQQVNSNIINSDVALGGREPWIINESGLYSTVLRSRKPQAKVFKKWITSEVLPSIRKTGQYSRSKTALELLRDQVDMAIAHERKMKELDSRQTVTEARVDALEGNYDWFAALGYAKLNGHPTNRMYLSRVGKAASRIMRDRGLEPVKRQDATFGEINTYPAEILREAFLSVDRPEN